MGIMSNPSGVVGPPGATGPAGSSAVTAGTTLPTSPSEGDLFSLLVDDTNGVEWLLRYRASTSTWRFVGGAPLYIWEQGPFAPASTTYVFSTGAPTLTLPSAGTSYDLMIMHGARPSQQGTGQIEGYASLSIAGSTPSDLDSVTVYADGQEYTAAHVTTELLKTSVASGSVIEQQYRVTTANTVVQISYGWLSITPRQVYP